MQLTLRDIVIQIRHHHSKLVVELQFILHEIIIMNKSKICI